MRKQYKPVVPAIKPTPLKFTVGDRVKPTEKAVSLGWTKPGVVISCGIHTVEVQMDGEQRPDYYSGDLWEAE